MPAEEQAKVPDRRKTFAPAQMLAGATRTKSALTDGYFEKFKRLYSDGDRPLWRDVRKEKMQYERLQKEKYKVKIPDHIKRDVPDSWYGTFGPQLERMDPRIDKPKFKLEPLDYNMYTSKVVKSLQGFPKHMPEPYHCQPFVHSLPDPLGRPPFLTPARISEPCFDKNPYITDRKNKAEWKTYNKDHEPLDRSHMRYGLYNNRDTQNKSRTDTNNCFGKFPPHMAEKFVDKWRQGGYQGYIEPHDSKNEKYGHYVTYGTSNRNKVDMYDCFDKYPERIKDGYVDKWRIKTPFAHEIGMID